MKDITVYFVAPHRKASCDNLIKYLKSSMYVKKTTKILVPEDPIFLEVELDNRYFSDGFPILRRIIFVKNLNQVPNKSKYFIDFECLLRWAKGRDMVLPDIKDDIKDEKPMVRDNIVEKLPDYTHTTDQIAKWIPTIKRIEQNIKKGNLYTTVFWEDGSKPTVVKAAQGEPTSIYSAVAAAISIKMYGSNSAFKRELKEKLNKESK